MLQKGFQHWPRTKLNFGGFVTGLRTGVRFLNPGISKLILSPRKHWSLWSASQSSLVKVSNSSKTLAVKNLSGARFFTGPRPEIGRRVSHLSRIWSGLPTLTFQVEVPRLRLRRSGCCFRGGTGFPLASRSGQHVTDDLLLLCTTEQVLPCFLLRWHRRPQPDPPRFPDVTPGANEARNVRCARMTVVFYFAYIVLQPTRVAGHPDPPQAPAGPPVVLWL
jgi:hypothetical protein